MNWLHQHVDAGFPAGGFAPRWCYAGYLRQALAGAVDAAGTVSLEQLRARVTDLRPHGRRLRLTLNDGASRAADAVVLAMGHSAPATSWAPEALRRSAGSWPTRGGRTESPDCRPAVMCCWWGPV